MAREKGYTKKNFLKGIVVENPLLVSILGTCPALAVTKYYAQYLHSTKQPHGFYGQL